MPDTAQCYGSITFLMCSWKAECWPDLCSCSGDCCRDCQYGRLASFGRFNWTFNLFIPIWKPFMAWMAACALAGLSKLTKPVGIKREWGEKKGKKIKGLRRRLRERDKRTKKIWAMNLLSQALQKWPCFYARLFFTAYPYPILYW